MIEKFLICIRAGGMESTLAVPFGVGAFRDEEVASHGRDSKSRF